ncbi:MAG: hypothetical protein H7123_05405 [Thermoleophilia bacterium]|nr:hypothetical protein [Thermoleophilia bacterium]
MTRAFYGGAILAAGVVLAACSSSLGQGDQSIRNTTRILGKRAYVTVTLDGGSRLVIRHNIPITRATTALDALREVADVRLGAGGHVVQVNGYGGGRETALGPDQSAWFVRINGVESSIDPARLRLKPGATVWWDLRRFDIYRHLPVAIGEFPNPLFTGYRDNRRPLRIAYGPDFQKDAQFLRNTVFQQLDPDVRPLRDNGTFGGLGGHSGPISTVAVRTDRANLIIGRWEDIKLDPYVLDIGLDPRGYGLTSWIEGTQIRQQPIDQEFDSVIDDAQGLVWASTVDGADDSAIVFVITGTTNAGVHGAVKALRTGKLQYYLSAVVDSDGKLITGIKNGPLAEPR